MSRFYTFFYLYDTEWLASSGGTKFLKSIKEMSKEELNVQLKCFYSSARKKDDTYCKSSLINPLKPPVDHFLRPFTNAYVLRIYLPGQR